jgi:predicted DNA-binding transcriptional regulator AlpA
MTAAVYLTPEQVSEMLGVAVRTLEDWRYKRTGPNFVKPTAHIVRYRQTDIDRWLTKQTVEAGR